MKLKLTKKERALIERTFSFENAPKKMEDNAAMMRMLGESRARYVENVSDFLYQMAIEYGLNGVDRRPCLGIAHASALVERCAEELRLEHEDQIESYFKRCLDHARSMSKESIRTSQKIRKSLKEEASR